MRDALAFAHFDLRTRLRGRAVALGAALTLGALALALGMARGDRGALATSWYPWVLGALGFAWAVGSAGALPGDRAEGRAAWLATLASAALSRRLGAALAGAVLALAATLTGALLVGLLAPPAGLARRVCEAHDVPLPAARRFLLDAAGTRTELTLEVGDRGAAAAGRLLEVDVRPLLLRRALAPSAAGAGAPDAAPPADDVLRLLVTRHGAPGADPAAPAAARREALDLPLSGRLRLPLEPGDRRVTLALAAGRADLVLRGARVLGAERSFVGSLLVVGLLLGLAAALLAPFAVAASRLVSAPVAALAGLVLLALSGMRALLPDLRALPASGALEQAARAVVDLGVRLAPDLSGLARAAEPADGRALPLAALAGLLPALPHALAYVVLLLLPARPGAPSEGAP